MICLLRKRMISYYDNMQRMAACRLHACLLTLTQLRKLNKPVPMYVQFECEINISPRSPSHVRNGKTCGFN